MLGAASLLQYPSIEKACCEFLCQHLHPSNCLRIEQFAHLHSCDTLTSAAHIYCLENFSSVVEFDEFLELPMTCLLSYLASDLINVRNEQDVYESVVKWIKHNVADRKHHLSTLLGKVRLTTVEENYLNNVITRVSFHESNILCRKIP